MYRQPLSPVREDLEDGWISRLRESISSSQAFEVPEEEFLDSDEDEGTAGAAWGGSERTGSTGGYYAADGGAAGAHPGGGPAPTAAAGGFHPVEGYDPHSHQRAEQHIAGVDPSGRYGVAASPPRYPPPEGDSSQGPYHHPLGGALPQSYSHHAAVVAGGSSLYYRHDPLDPRGTPLRMRPQQEEQYLDMPADELAGIFYDDDGGEEGGGGWASHGGAGAGARGEYDGGGAWPGGWSEGGEDEEPGWEREVQREHEGGGWAATGAGPDPRDAKPKSGGKRKKLKARPVCQSPPAAPPLRAGAGGKITMPPEMVDRLHKQSKESLLAIASALVDQIKEDLASAAVMQRGTRARSGRGVGRGADKQKAAGGSPVVLGAAGAGAEAGAGSEGASVAGGAACMSGEAAGEGELDAIALLTLDTSQ